MQRFRISQAARACSASRRYIEHDKLPVERDASNSQVIDGVVLAEFARQHAHCARPVRRRALGPQPTSA